MIGWPRGLTIHLALAPVDFRKSFQGLSLGVLEGLGRDPLGGEIFVFRNRAGDKLKALYWDGQGFVLIYKRLERGRFPWPWGVGDGWGGAGAVGESATGVVRGRAIAAPGSPEYVSRERGLLMSF